jgi:Fe-S oxidoreductase
MKLETTLKEVQGAASLCIKCAGCTYAEWPETHALCPIYSRDETFTFSGGGLMYLAKALADNQIKFSQPLAELLATCTSCGACDSRCGIIRSQAPYVNPLDIIRLARYSALKAGFVPAGLAKRIAAELKKTGDFGAPGDLALPAAIKSEKAENVIFAECLHSPSQSQILAAEVKLLGKIGEPVSIFSEKGCCGSTLYDFGFWDDLKPLVKAQWAKMKKKSAKTFVFNDPHCQEFIQKRYPEILSDYKPLKTQHISQLLAKAFQDGRLKSKKAAKMVVSYHDPCYLGRTLGIYDAPREAITALQGVKLVEMERHKQNSFCCGARALGNYLPEMNEWTAKERLQEFEATGADLLITACPYCRENFRQSLPAKDKNRVMDLVELVDQRT